ncbi:hypothetical protein ABZ858_19375 [Streptomyces sp. NPDC047017]
MAISRPAAQRDGIGRLRKQLAADGNVRGLPARAGGTAPYGSCS